MNNIQKAFKRKCGLRMATGGVLLSPGRDNDLARAAQMGGAADVMAANNNALGSGSGFVSMDFDPQANLNSLSPSTGTPINPFYGPAMGNDPKFSGSTDPDIQRANLRARASPPTPRPAPATNTMTPVDELLPSRRGLQLANGGVVAETPEQVMARMAAKYGVSAAPAATPNPPVTPAPAPVAQPAQPSGGLFQGAVRTLRGRAAQIDKATGYAQGGVAVVKGPGTGTSDDIPISLNAGGERMNINVSNGEGLAVLPAKTMQHPEAIDAVNTIIETTNGKPPRGLKAGASYAVGTAGLIDDEVRARAAQARVTTPTPAPTPTATATAAGPNMAPELEIPAEKPAPNAVRRMADKVAEKVGYSRAAPATATPAAPTARVAEAPLSRVGSIRQAISGKNATTVGDVIRKTKDVVTGPRAAQTGAGMLRAGSVAAGLEGAYRGLNTDTDDYYARTGIDREATVVPQMVKDLGVRGLGVLSDVGASAINGVMLPANLLTHGLDTDKWYDYRDNFADVAAKKENALVPTPVKPAPEAIEPGAQERTFSAGKPGAAAPAPTTAAGADTAPTNDIQRRTIRGANGQPQTEFYGKDVKQTYTGADGKPTNRWEDTQDYKNAIGRQQEDKELLRTMQRWNAKSDAASPNEFYQRRGLQQLAHLDKQEQLATAKEVATADRDIRRQGLDIQREDLGLRRAQEARALKSAQFGMEKDMLAMQRQEREAAQDADKKAYTKYSPLFTVEGKDKDGNPTFTEDKTALADAQRVIEYTLAQRGLINPTTGQTKNFGSLSDAERDALMNRIRAVQRLRQTQGNWFWNADKGDSLNLDDFDAVDQGDDLHFPKLSKRLGKDIRARKKDFIYGDGPSSILKYNQTPDTTFLQSLTNPMWSR